MTKDKRLKLQQLRRRWVNDKMTFASYHAQLTKLYDKNV